MRVQVRYSGPFLNWTREKFRKVDIRMRKLMTMHPRDNIDRVHARRKEVGRGLASSKDCVNVVKSGTQRIHQQD